MIAKSYILTIVVTALLSLVGGGIYTIYRMIETRDQEISSLRGELLDTYTAIAKRNFELQKQANEFQAFNDKRFDFEKSLVNKYSVTPQEGDPCNTDTLNLLLRKSFDNDE